MKTHRHFPWKNWKRLCRKSWMNMREELLLIISLMRSSLLLQMKKILQLQALAEKTAAADMHELMFAYELRERLIVCRSLIAHLKNRKETRWHSF